MTDDTIPLSPRHERFVLEYLKDGNATQAYLRAGYSPRGAQPSASRLLRDPRIEAAIAAGRQHIAQSLEVTVERIAQEYAKMSFASIDDFVSVDADGRLRVDLGKASQAQRAGILELKITNHRKGEQTVTLKLGKAQALAALTKHVGVLVQKPAPGLTAEDRQRYEEHCAGYRRLLDHREQEKERLRQELREARAALAASETRRLTTGIENPNRLLNPNPFSRRQAEPSEPPQEAAQPEEPPPQPAVMPGMPTQPLPDHVPGLYPNAKFVWSGGREHGLGPDSADALRMMKPGAFPGR